MNYTHILAGRFLYRPNRFVAQVELSGQVVSCHVKNTGRCQELLVPGADIWCQKAENPVRKTAYDLIAVQKGSRLINMDAQAPNTAAGEWLRSGGLGPIENLRPETVHGDSRFDFAFTRNGQPCLLEVKGVTLEESGVVRFPDAPTPRGAKHLRGLAKAVEEGFGAYVLFVIQMANVTCFCPNDRTDPNFGLALRKAAAAGVEILAVDCDVTPNSMAIRNPVPVDLTDSF